MSRPASSSLFRGGSYVRRYNEIVYNIANMGRSNPDREKRGIERKCNRIIDLQCYKLFHCTVGPMRGSRHQIIIRLGL